MKLEGQYVRSHIPGVLIISLLCASVVVLLGHGLAALIVFIVAFALGFAALRAIWALAQSVAQAESNIWKLRNFAETVLALIVAAQVLWMLRGK